MQGDSTKRVRYASEDEDDNLIGDATELDFPNRKGRRGAVKDTEGYHSDSSNEDDETMIKRDSRTNAMDEEDDMFGTADPASGKTGVPDLNPADNDTRIKDTGLQLQGDAAKGGKEFLELGDIEGQEFDDKGDESSYSKEKREALQQHKKVTEDDEDYVSGDEKANDDDAVVPAERKSQTGLGFAVSSFNMKDEMSEGRFTADGTYQANSKDPDAVYDNWLGGVTTKDIESAQKAKERQDALLRQRSEQIAASSMNRIDCLKALLEGNGGLVKPGESVQAALARLGKARKEEVEQEKERLKKERRQNKASSSSKPKKDFDAPDEPSMHHPASAESSNKTETHDMDLDPLAPPNPSSSSALAKGKGRETDSTMAASSDSQTKIAIDRLTTLASTLLGVHGETDIYEETHEGIIRQLIAEGEVPRGWTPKNDAPAASSANGKQENGSNGKDNVRKSVVSRPLISRPRAQ